MKANLIEIRKKDFVSKDTNENIEGYVATFLVPAYKHDYPPSLVSFYLSAEHYLTYLLLRKLDIWMVLNVFSSNYDYVCPLYKRVKMEITLQLVSKRNVNTFNWF